MFRSTHLWLSGLALGLAACGGASGDDLFGKGSLGKSPPASGGAAPSGSGGGWSTSGGSAGRSGPGGAASGGDAGTGGDSGSSAATGGAGSTPGGGTGGTPNGGAGGAPGGSGGAPTAGQCTNFCGGPIADQSCWCDAFCSLYGDCCPDFVASCPAEASTPPPTGGCTAGLCGSEQPSSENGDVCYCDGACAQYGDCCSNKQAVCGG